MNTNRNNDRNEKNYKIFRQIREKKNSLKVAIGNERVMSEILKDRSDNFENKTKDIKQLKDEETPTTSGNACSIF